MKTLNSISVCILSLFCLLPIQDLSGQTIDWYNVSNTDTDERLPTIAVDYNGCLIKSNRTQTTGYSISKFDTDGNLMWEEFFLPLTGFIRAVDICVDSDGCIYVAEYNVEQNNSEQGFFFLRKLDSIGMPIWKTPVGSPGTINGIGPSITEDDNGSVYFVADTTGNFGGQNFGATDLVIAKFETTLGQLTNVVQLGTSSRETISRCGFSIHDEHLYVCGSTNGDFFQTNLGDSDAIVAKFTPDLELVWGLQLGSSEIDFFNRISIDSAGNLVVAGSTFGHLGEAVDENFLGKLTPLGDVEWIKPINGSYIFGMATGNDGKILFCGGNSGNQVAELYDSDGVFSWRRKLHTNEEEQIAREIATTRDGETIYVAGTEWAGSGFPRDYFVAKLSFGTIVESSPTQIVRGITASGGEGQIGEPDNQYWNLNPGFTLNANEPPVWLRQDVNLSFESPESLILTLATKANSVGLTQEIEVFNWTTNQYDSRSVRDVSFNSGFSVFLDISHLGDDYVQPQTDGTGLLRWQTKCSQTGFTFLFPWTYSIDVFACEVE